MLKGSNILFISVKTFNYEQYIVEKLEELGSNVLFFDERPNNSVFAKGLIRIKKSLYSYQISKYYNQILDKIKNKNFDYLFVIKGEVIPEFFIRSFKKMNSSAILIYYTWDSFKNNPNGLNIESYFDKKFSFDPIDASKYNLNFRPLFYIDEYKKIKNEINNNIKNKYQVLFVGTAHSDRYTISQNVSNWCRLNKISYYNYYYISNIFVFLIKKIFDKSFKKFRLNEMSYLPLKINDLFKLYSESNVILDINHPDQDGLTMRTFEALGSGKKIITTNKNIEKYVFFNPNNILVISRNQKQLPLYFFNQKFEDYDDSLNLSMSLQGWLISIFSPSYENNWFINK
jgi:hypothetical protein